MRWTQFRLVLVAGLNPPMPFPRRIDTLTEPLFATAMSGLPSPLKSPAATALGFVPTEKLVAAPNRPLPSPKRIEMLFEPLFATAISCLPSPLKSPIAMDLGPVPTAKPDAPANFDATHGADER